MTTAAPERPEHSLPQLPIDPRLRQRWMDVRRAEGRKRLRVVLVVLAAVVLVGSVLALLESPLARVRHTRVFGAGPVPASAVIAAAGLTGERLMVDVHPDSEAARIDALPWVATANVRRQWPSTIRITLTVRVPVAVLSAPSGRALLDSTGRVLAVGSTAGVGLPALTVDATVGAPGTWLAGSPGSERGFLGAERGSDAASAAGSASGTHDATLVAELALADALRASTATLVATEAVTSQDGLIATVGTTTVVFGDTSQLVAKVIGLEALVAHQPLAAIARVDLRVPDRPALTPVPPQGP